MAIENDHSFTMQERLSALADGELSADEIAVLLDAMDADPAALDAWTLLHASAAAIRGEQINASSGDVAFWQTLQEQLNAEPALPVFAQQVSHVSSSHRSGANAANEPFWRIRSMTMMAIVLAAGCLTAVLWPTGGAPEGLSAAENGSEPIVAAIPVSDGNVMLRNPELDALMAAHQQMGGHSALQAPSGFLRNATFERSTR